MKEEVQSDQQLEALFHDLKFQEPELYCGSNQRITRACVNPQCNKSLICNEFECPQCGFNVHPICSSVSLSNLTCLVNKTTSLYKQFCHRTQEMQKNFLDAFHRQRKDFRNNSFHQFFSQKEKKILDRIYKKDSPNSVRGEDMKWFCRKIKDSFEQKKQKMQNLLLNYNQQLTQTLKIIIQTRQNVLNKFVQNHCLIKSKIIKGNQQKQYLSDILLNPRQFKLLYRGSEHNFSSKKFHELCDNIKDTVTIVQTEYGKIVGGFTKYTWNQVPEDRYVEDPLKKAFLFSLDQKKKIVSKNKERLIYCHQNNGPCFGYQDLWIKDPSQSSFGDFPDQYNYEGQVQFNRNQASIQKFIGSSTKNFKYRDYEVFQVIPQ